MESTESLKARIEVINKSHQTANEYYPKFINIFEKYVGQKVLKADGCLLAKIATEVANLSLPNTPNLQIYRQRSNHILWWTVRASSCGHWTHTYESTIDIGELDLGTLKNISPHISYRDNFTVEEALVNREAYRVLKHQAERAANACHPYGTG